MKNIIVAVLLILVAGRKTIAQPGATTTITLQIPEINEGFENLDKGDSLSLTLYQDMLKGRPVVKRDVNGKWNAEKNEYSFSIEGLTGTWYFSIVNKSKATNWSAHRILAEYWRIEPGDKVHILCKPVQRNMFNYVKGKYFIPYSEYFFFGHYHPVFSGKGALKYRLKYQVDSMTLTQTDWNSNLLDSAGGANRHFFIQSGIRNAVHHLAAYRKQLGEHSYQLLRTDIIAGMGDSWIEQYHVSSLYKLAVKERVLTQFYHDYISQLNAFTKGIPADALEHSIWYSTYIAHMYLIFKGSALALNDRNFPFINNYQILEQISATYSGATREKILLEYIAGDSKDTKEDMRFLLQVMAAFSTDRNKQRLLDHLSNLAPGSLAYDFSLPDTSGRMVSLSDFRGKVVLLDCWFVGCGGCKAYFKKVVAPVEEHYKDNKDVVFITVSVDYSREKWLQGIKSGEYTSGRAVNLYTDSLGSDHIMISNYRITSYPFPILIDREGRIFTTNINDLSINGPQGLINTIERALKKPYSPDL